MKFMFSASLHVLLLLFYLSYLLPVPGGSEGCKFSEGWFVQIVPSETELSFLGGCLNVITKSQANKTN